MKSPFFRQVVLFGFQSVIVSYRQYWSGFYRFSIRHSLVSNDTLKSGFQAVFMRVYDGMTH